MKNAAPVKAPLVRKVAVKKPLNGSAELGRKVLVASSLPKVITKKMYAPKGNASPPIIIKVRTMAPEDLEKRKKREDEKDEKYKNRKVIRVRTQTKRIPLGALMRLYSLAEDEEGEIEFERKRKKFMTFERDDQMEMEWKMKGDGDLPRPKTFNEKILYLCERSQRLLKARKEQFVNKKLTVRVPDLSLPLIDKFAKLTAGIVQKIKDSFIEEGGSKLSQSKIYNTYRQEILESIAQTIEDPSVLTHAEADDLLNLVRQRYKPIRPNFVPSPELEFLTNVLEITSLGTNFSYGDDEEEDSDEEEDDEEDDDDEEEDIDDPMGHFDEEEGMDYGLD